MQVYMRVDARGAITSRIEAVLSVDAWGTAYAGPESSYLVPGEFDAATQWFDDGVLADRPTLADEAAAIIADGIDTFSLPIPPNGEVVYLTGGRQAVDVSDGRFEFQTTVPGVYAFEFDCFPYRKQTITVTAHAVPG